MADIESIRVEIDKIVEEARERINLRTLRPWWYSGSAWLVGIFWLNFLGMMWAGLLGKLPESTDAYQVGAVGVLFFILAFVTSMWHQGKNKL